MQQVRESKKNFKNRFVWNGEKKSHHLYLHCLLHQSTGENGFELTLAASMFCTNSLTYIFFLVISTVVPIVMGACALYFYLAAKVYTHQALFVYAQPYEGT